MLCVACSEVHRAYVSTNVAAMRVLVDVGGRLKLFNKLALVEFD